MHLVSISIGPVQDFIAAARSTRDLAAGSKLLAKIVKAAAKTFPNPPDEPGVFGPGRIFPTDVGGGGANKILALVDGDPAAAVATARDAANAALKIAWDEFRADGTLSRRQWSLIDSARATAQIDTLLEVYGAWVDVPDEAAYAQARKDVDAFLAGRKDLRNFAQSVGDDVGLPKSPLDPSRASVVTKRGGLSTPADLRGAPLWLRGDEVLDGISLLKRLYGRSLEAPVLSTRDLAQRSLSREYGPNNEEEFEPDFPYFAILVADGDHMGQHIDQLRTPSQHREFSQALDEFAKDAATYIELHDGQPIYTGGDDVMALLPISTAIACANELAQLFTETMRPKDGNIGWAPTISCGLAIVHYREPLSLGLDRARRAEATAKEKRGRLALTLDKRSGQPLVVTEPWPDGLPKMRLQTWAEAFANGDLAGRLPYRLRTLADEWPPEVTGEALEAETRRIIKRSRPVTGRPVLEALGEGTLPTSQEDLRGLVDTLVVARFLGGVLA